MLSLVLTASLVLAADPAKPSYFHDVRPIFVQHCQGCHQPAKAQGSYVMTDLAAILKPGESAKPPVVKGKPEESFLVASILLKATRSKPGSPRVPLMTHQRVPSSRRSMPSTRRSTRRCRS
jgi:hypothetical protein